MADKETPDPAFEVSFQITRTQRFDSGELVKAACDALFRAITKELEMGPGELILAREAFDAKVGRKLAAGAEVRLPLSPIQFARFFVERRRAGGEVPRRLKWFDAVEITAEEE